MKAATSIIFVCLTLFLLDSGCSREEEPLPPPQKTRVVKSIQKPLPEKPKTPPDSEKVTTKPGEKEGEDLEPAAVEEKPSIKPEEEAREKETVLAQEGGYYIVKEGDTLASIAAREDVYGDPLKWPILCRLNMDKLGTMMSGDNFLDRNLPAGIRLKIVTADEAEENLKKRDDSPWVVNVLSSQKEAEIISAAIRLVKEGYPAYITGVELKGKDWLRVRVGFFEKKTEADTEGKKIMTMLKLSDSWTVKAGEQELETFGRY